MKRLIVKCTDGGTCNIEVDRIEQLENDTNYIIARKDNEIVGAFDLGSVSIMYVSEQWGKE